MLTRRKRTRSGAFRRRSSDLQYLFLFALQRLLDLPRGLVGEALKLALGAALVVLAGLPLLLQLAQVVHHVAADVSHRLLSLLGDAVDDLDQFAAALLVQLRDREPDHVAVVGGSQTQVGLQDR